MDLVYPSNIPARTCPECDTVLINAFRGDSLIVIHDFVNNIAAFSCAFGGYELPYYPWPPARPLDYPELFLPENVIPVTACPVNSDVSGEDLAHSVLAWWNDQLARHNCPPEPHFVTLARGYILGNAG